MILRSLALSLATASLVSGFALQSDFRLRNDKVCTTLPCLEAAVLIKGGIDFKVDPCDDFYAFACGRFENVTRIPDDKTSMSAFTTMSEQLYDEGRDLLEDEKTPDEWPIYQKVRDQYNSCMDEEARDSLGPEPVKQVFETVGGWPVLCQEQDEQQESNSARRKRQNDVEVDLVQEEQMADEVKEEAESDMDAEAVEEEEEESNDTQAKTKSAHHENAHAQGGGQKYDEDQDERSWYDLQAELDKLGFSSSGHILSSYVYQDLKQNDRRILYLDQPSLGLAREHYVGDGEEAQKRREAYLKYMVDTAVYFGAEREKAERDMKETMEFEHALAELSDPREARRDSEKLYNPVKLSDFERLDGHPPDWKQYLETLIDQELEEDEIVVVRNQRYVKEVAELLNTTPKRTVRNYLLWRAAKASMGSLDATAREITHQYSKATRGVKEQKPLWKQCLEEVGFQSRGTGFAIITASMYVRRFFKEEAKAKMKEMTGLLRVAMNEKLGEAEWMDEETRVAAKLKLDKMLEGIAYPDEMLDQDKMNELFEELETKEGGFFQNGLNVNKFWNRWYNANLRKTAVRDDWLDNGIFNKVILVNAFYSSNANAFVFPAGFLRGVFFNPAVPMYMNYAGVGSVIGHEISHGFDDQGRQTDEVGLLRNWWSESTLTQYKERAQCIIDQYSGFVELGLNLNGINGQGENIADIVGLEAAYRAYELWGQKHGVEPLLPGLPFNNRQMFWIHRARSWCRKNTPESLKNQILTGYHSPARWRINGPSMNNNDFARDFNCERGAKMNPVDKCVIY